MITEHEKKLIQQTLDEQQDELERARRHHNEGMARVLEHAVAFESSDTTRSQKLEHCIRAAAEKLRLDDAAGALLTLEQGMRI